MPDKSMLPLSGLRVLDVATFIAAPYAAAILGEFGAEIIKVEQPGTGDPMRRFGTSTARDGDTLAWLSEARNKSSITLDLKAERGRDLLLQLVAKADVVAENFRPGTLEKWGLGWDQLRAVNPGLILLRVSGYGQTGPYKDRPGFARIAHAFGGLSHLAGMPGGAPVTPGSTSLADYLSGLYGVIGILVALRHRDRSGEGQIIDIALYESILRVLDEVAPAYAMTGKVREREGAGTLNVCPHGHFPTADGKWVAIACTNDKMFARLTAVMKRPDLAESHAKLAQRLTDRDAIDTIVTSWTLSDSQTGIVAQCVAGQVPCGPINSIADIFADPHIQARENLLKVAEQVLGHVTIPNVLPRLSATPGRVEHLGPSLGDANEAIYRGLLGLSEKDLAALRRDGVV